MPHELTYPGVYVEEVPSGVRTIAGVSTSTTVFIGPVTDGPVLVPMECLSEGDYRANFPAMSASSALSLSVRLFFQNGGNKCFVVGITGPAGPGSGTTVPNGPGLAEYQKAFDVIEKGLDIFNLLVIPIGSGQDGATTKAILSEASKLCQRRRAMLVIDAPPEWSAGLTDGELGRTIAGFRQSLVADHCAVFLPRVQPRTEGVTVMAGVSGAIAGLMARMDATRGVWKAPAGIETDIRGIVGLERDLTDSENGVLNKRGINVVRRFPEGIVNWGARTLAGDDDLASDWKYIPVRRMALFIEESLFRGTKWVVFEPNDEPLWAQIRANVGAFMHDLFRKGAFQGKSPKEAYFVKCDKEMTTQTDRDRGVVNILVGFAPLKPAEFVMLKITQLAGKISI